MSAGRHVRREGLDREPTVAVSPLKVPKRFLLVRDFDVSGVSGVGVVAEGVEFTDGHCAVRWVSEDKPSSTVCWASVDDVVAVHGHGGHTRVTWIEW